MTNLDPDLVIMSTTTDGIYEHNVLLRKVEGKNQSVEIMTTFEKQNTQRLKVCINKNTTLVVYTRK